MYRKDRRVRLDMSYPGEKWDWSESLLGCVGQYGNQFLFSCYDNGDALAVRAFDTTGKDSEAVNLLHLDKQLLKVKFALILRMLKVQKEFPFKAQDLPNEGRLVLHPSDPYSATILLEVLKSFYGYGVINTSCLFIRISEE